MLTDQKSFFTYTLFFFLYVDSQPLQWKTCKTFKSSSSKVLDVQFGISLTTLKMVSFIAIHDYIDIYFGTICLNQHFKKRLLISVIHLSDAISHFCLLP